MYTCDAKNSKERPWKNVIVRLEKAAGMKYECTHAYNGTFQ